MDCWAPPLLTYEVCCRDATSTCWADHDSFTRCCTPPDPGCDPPLTFSHVPLRLGQPPPHTEQIAAGRLVPIGKLERNWHTGGGIDAYRSECIALLKNDSWLNSFRSRDGQLLFVHPTHMFSSRVNTPSWRVHTTLSALRRHPAALRILGRVEVGSAFDRMGSPELMDVTARGRLMQVSHEYLVTVHLFLAMLDAIRHPYAGHISGQAADGENGGLPTDDSMHERLHLPWNIIEVGAGWGFMALLTQILFKVRSYSIVDLPEAELLQYRLLDMVLKTTAFLSTNLTSEDVLPRYDLFISTWAYTELDEHLRDRYFNRLIVRCRRGFIVDNSHQMRLRMDSRSGTAFADRTQTTGLDLVRRLQQVGFTVRLQTLQEAMRLPHLPDHGGVTTVISWVNTTEPLGPDFDYYMNMKDWPILDKLYDT